ncbi:MAG: signal peptidase II [Alphaproteobacteria bacterium]|nr:signal peptidase II [Alphaproteobacteria bacterium]
MLRLGLLVALLTLVLDQASKAAVLYGLDFIHCAPCRGFIDVCIRCPPIELTPFFSLSMVWNEGISFGLFQAETLLDRIFLIGFATIVASALTFWMSRTQDRLVTIALGLVIGGAVGNVIDRVYYGAVTDFLDFHLFGYHWYTFNIADAAIVMGVGLLLLDALVLRGDEGAGKKPLTRHGETE